MNHMTGHVHPIPAAISRINTIFYALGYEFAEGPLIETQYYNFDALNVPRDHPARDMQDTFFIQDGTGESVLRTHTSSVQVRYMEKHKPPIRIIAPGRTFRNEATDATHEATFFQFEGLYIDKNVSLADLKGTLEHFFSAFYEREITVRFRPAFFPFVEPGVEVDMLFKKKDGTDKWIEVMGAGMVHPNVLRAGGIDPDEYSGFAFGIGIERLIMIAADVPDIRLFHTGDLRFTHQF